MLRGSKVQERRLAPSNPPAAALADLARLRATLDQSGIPPKSLDRNVLITTWNIRGFGRMLDMWESAAGDSPRPNLGDVLCRAEIIACFDVVALQEVRLDLSDHYPLWASFSVMPA